MSFSNKVVIVIGASSGIGAATALLFAQEGADVALVGRNEVKLKTVTAQCEEAGSNPLMILADITKEDQAISIIEKTIDKYGKLDILINNAGIVRLASIIDGTTLTAFDDLINTNLRAIIHLTTLATPHLIKTKGNIINISSVAGKVTKSPKFLCYYYSISKTALNIFSKGAAIELAPYGIRVNTISPGPVYSDIWENSKLSLETLKDVYYKSELNRISKPEEIGNLILYLAGDKSIGITGSNFIADNGFDLLRLEFFL